MTHFDKRAERQYDWGLYFHSHANDGSRWWARTAVHRGNITTSRPPLNCAELLRANTRLVHLAWIAGFYGTDRHVLFLTYLVDLGYR